MPALEAFGRKWHIASDDLPLPMLTLMTFHTIWCVVVMIAYVGAYENLHTCPHGYTFGVYMLCVIFVFAAAWTIELAIYHASMKGAAPTAHLAEVQTPGHAKATAHGR